MRFPKLNQIILLLIIAEFIIATGNAITAPIFALFVTQDIGAAAYVVGFSISIYWATKSILQLPIARYLDKNHGELDDYYAIIIGLFFAIVAVFSMYFAAKAWHMYALLAMLAIGDSFVVPPFYAIFTRHIDKGNEGLEWALRSSFSLGAGTALGGALSGVLGALIGFRTLFLLNGLFMFFGWIVLLFLRPWIIPRGSPPVERIFIERSNR